MAKPKKVLMKSIENIIEDLIETGTVSNEDEAIILISETLKFLDISSVIKQRAIRTKESLKMHN